MTDRSAHARHWQDLAVVDPLWAVLTMPGKRDGGWDIDEFLASGREEITRVLARGRELGLPERTRRALDFGCGVGRLTRAMAESFDEVVGVDIAPEMLAKASQLNADRENLRFVRNERDDLGAFESQTFDFVYSFVVLQHLPSRRAMLRFVEEFVRVLAPGGLLVFQVPSHIPPMGRIQPRRRAYRVLRSAGVPAEVLYRRLGLDPISMNFAPVAEVTERLEAAGGRLLRKDADPTVDGIESYTYVVTRGEIEQP